MTVHNNTYHDSVDWLFIFVWFSRTFSFSFAAIVISAVNIKRRLWNYGISEIKSWENTPVTLNNKYESTLHVLIHYSETHKWNNKSAKKSLKSASKSLVLYS